MEGKMKYKSLLVAAGVAAVLTVAGMQQSQAQSYGWGMMGGGYGPGYSGHMGYGYGPGWMHQNWRGDRDGRGYSYGPRGGYGPGYGRSSGYGCPGFGGWR
jgi:hypothetical protein